MNVILLLTISFAFVAVITGLMTVGLWFGRKPIKGTCGGLAAMQGESCSICGGRPDKCKTAQSGAGDLKTEFD